MECGTMIINLNKVVGLWTEKDIKSWSVGEKTELMRLLIASIEYDYSNKRR